MKGDVKNKLHLTWLLTQILGSQPRSIWSYRVASHPPLPFDSHFASLNALD
jgi:hypothetical protein